MLFLLGARFALAQTLSFSPLPGIIDPPSDIAKHVDLNNDGRNDIVSWTVDSLSNIKINVRLNNPDGTHKPTISTVLPLQASNGLGFHVAKLTPNSPNYGLILTGVFEPNNFVTNHIATLKGNGDGTFSAPVITRGIVTDFVNNFRVNFFVPVDLSGEGYHAHLIKTTSNSNTNNPDIYRLQADGTYSTTPVAQIILPVDTSNPISIFKVLDLNKDGKDDLIIARSDYWYFLTGGGSIGAPTPTSSFTLIPEPVSNLPLSSRSSVSLLEMGDVNGDGLPDFLIITSTLFPTLDPNSKWVYSVHLNDGTGKPSATPTASHTSTCKSTPRGELSPLISCVETGDDISPGSPIGYERFSKLLDLDGDGYADIVNIDIWSNSILTFNKSKGDGTFEAAQTYNANGFYPISTNIGSNGTPSFFAIDSTGHTIIMQNTLNASVASTTTLAINPTTPLFGQSTTLTATVTGKQPGGVVNFTDGTTSLGSAPLVNGKATLTLPAGLTSGSHALTASFPSDFRNKASSASSTITVAPPVTVLPKFTSVSDDTVKEGQKAKFKVSFSAATTEAASVRVTLLDGTTSGALDYSTTLKYSDDNGMTYRSMDSGGTAGVRAGATSLLIQVDTLKDNINEPTETFNLSVEPLSGLAPDRGWAVGTILNKSAKHNSMFDQVRSIRDDVTRKGDSVTSSIRNWVSMSVFRRLFSWR